VSFALREANTVHDVRLVGVLGVVVRKIVRASGLLRRGPKRLAHDVVSNANEICGGAVPVKNDWSVCVTLNFPTSALCKNMFEAYVPTRFP